MEEWSLCGACRRHDVTKNTPLYILFTAHRSSDSHMIRNLYIYIFMYISCTDPLGKV